MVSNSKLNAFQKGLLKEMRMYQKGVTVGNNGKTTIAYREFPNTVEFSLSVSSDTEQKFRARVGEFHARDRMDHGVTVKMDKNDFDAMFEFVFCIGV
jgi:hypothetical protein